MGPVIKRNIGPIIEFSIFLIVMILFFGAQYIRSSEVRTQQLAENTSTPTPGIKSVSPTPQATISSTPAPQTNPEPVAKVYFIPEFDVAFALPNVISDLTVMQTALPSSQPGQTVGFSTKSLIDAGCSTQDGPLGYLTYSTNQTNGELIAVVNDRSYYYIKPTKICDANIPTEDLISVLNSALKTLVEK